MQPSAQEPDSSDPLLKSNNSPNPKVTYQTLSETLVPLVRLLTSIEHTKETGIVDQRRHTTLAAKTIKKFLEGVDLFEVELDLNAFLFMHKDPIGSMIRRPVISALCHTTLEKHLPASPNLAYLALWEHIAEDGYRYFEGCEAQLDFDKRLEVLRIDPIYSTKLAAILHEHFRERGIQEISEQLDIQYDKDRVSGCDWISDPGHGLRIFSFSTLSAIISRDLEINYSNRLDCRFAHIDDDKWNFWFEAFEYLANQRELYFTGKAALEKMFGAVELPQIILSDVDLGEGVNGVEVVKQLREHATKNNQRPLIYLYTSAYVKYFHQAQELIEQGVIDGYLDKRNLDLNSFRIEVEEKLKQFH